MAEPTDDELDAVIAEYRTRIYPQDMHPRFERAIMRAAIAKWGAPPAVDWIGASSHHLLHPTQAQAGAVPLMDEQIRAMCKESWVFETVKQWVRITEQHHGIKGGQHAE